MMVRWLCGVLSGVEWIFSVVGVISLPWVTEHHHYRNYMGAGE